VFDAELPTGMRSQHASPFVSILHSASAPLTSPLRRIGRLLWPRRLKFSWCRSSVVPNSIPISGGDQGFVRGGLPPLQNGDGALADASAGRGALGGFTIRKIIC